MRTVSPASVHVEGIFEPQYTRMWRGQWYIS
jgi:hypothetical protein